MPNACYTLAPRYYPLIRRFFALCALCALLLLGGCGGASNASAPQTTPTTVTQIITQTIANASTVTLTTTTTSTVTTSTTNTVTNTVINTATNVVAVPSGSPNLTLGLADAVWDGGQFTGQTVIIRTGAGGAPTAAILAGGTNTTINIGASVGVITGYFQSDSHSSAAIATINNRGIISQPNIAGANTANITFYAAPQPLYLVTAGGRTVAAGAANIGKTLNFTHRLFRSSRSTGGRAFYTHYLGAEYAAFAFTFAGGDFYGGIATPRRFFLTTALSSVTYHIPPGAAFGYQSYDLYTNLTLGALAVNLTNNSAFLNLTLVDANVLPNATSTNSFAFVGWQMSLSAGRGIFSNHHCPSGGGRATTFCGGTATFMFGGRSISVNNNNAPTHVLTVHGGFYGNDAQEVAIAAKGHFFRSLPGFGNIAISPINLGILGRRANPATGGSPPEGGASGSAGAYSPAGALATFADGSAGISGAGAAALAQAEHAAFSAMQGTSMRIAHRGTRSPAAAVAARSDTATYNITIGGAGGMASGSEGIISLANTTPGALQVDFAQDTARLNLQVGDSNGSTYALNNIGLNLHTESNALQFCANCGGSVQGSGALARFTSTQVLQINGAFYGNNAQNAAAALHHTQGGTAVDIGFVAAE